MMIPRSLSRTLSRQDLAVLYEIQDLVESLIKERNEAVKADCSEVNRSETNRSGDDHSGADHPRREVLEEKKTGSITYRLERVSCGKGCKGCPHGPYWYGYWKEGGKTRSKYIGKKLVV